MCLAIPAKVVEIGKGKGKGEGEGKGKGKEGAKAKVDFGGVYREIDISLVDTKIGDYVMVHAGFAIEIMDEHEAKETIELWKEMLEKCF